MRKYSKVLANLSMVLLLLVLTRLWNLLYYDCDRTYSILAVQVSWVPPLLSWAFLNADSAVKSHSVVALDLGGGLLRDGLGYWLEGFSMNTERCSKLLWTHGQRNVVLTWIFVKDFMKAEFSVIAVCCN